MKTEVFRGCGAALVTPMRRNDDSIDLDLYRRLVRLQLAAGANAVIVCGTTGEPSTLSEEEYLSLIKTAVSVAAGSVPVIAGAGSNDTMHAVWLSKLAEAAGADALLHVTPYYNKTTQSGLCSHFFTIADQCSVPVIIYNVPSRTGMSIAPETYRELSRHPLIVAAKEAGGNLAALTKAMALCGDDLGFYCGSDELTVPFMSLGGLGVISVLANIMPAETIRLTALCLSGDYRSAAILQKRFSPLIDALFCEVSPIPVKEAMLLLGIDCGGCRLPLPPIEPGHRELLRAELIRAGAARF